MSKIRFLIMDVDGTLTDGKIYISPSGEAMKAFNIKDGFGIRNIAITNGIKPIIITNRESDIVINRCKELGITQIYQGICDKVKQIRSIAQNEQIDFSCIAYIGDDLNDLSSIDFINKSGGLTGCPLDAEESVKKAVHYVSVKSGGDGAVRDFIEYIVKNNK